MRPMNGELRPAWNHESSREKGDPGHQNDTGVGAGRRSGCTRHNRSDRAPWAGSSRRWPPDRPPGSRTGGARPCRAGPPSRVSLTLGRRHDPSDGTDGRVPYPGPADFFAWPTSPARKLPPVMLAARRAGRKKRPAGSFCDQPSGSSGLTRCREPPREHLSLARGGGTTRRTVGRYGRSFFPIGRRTDSSHARRRGPGGHPRSCSLRTAREKKPPAGYSSNQSSGPSGPSAIFGTAN
jgi:hypothetical protein